MVGCARRDSTMGRMDMAQSPSCGSVAEDRPSPHVSQIATNERALCAPAEVAFGRDRSGLDRERRATKAAGGHAMKVGFIGLGNVGSKLSGTLLRNGVDLVVRDLDAAKVAEFTAKGASTADSPAAMLAEVDIVITCLPRPDISAAVVEGPNG